MLLKIAGSRELSSESFNDDAEAAGSRERWLRSSCGGVDVTGYWELTKGTCESSMVSGSRELTKSSSEPATVAESRGFTESSCESQIVATGRELGSKSVCGRMVHDMAIVIFGREDAGPVRKTIVMAVQSMMGLVCWSQGRPRTICADGWSCVTSSDSSCDE
jgi:hypothetical protein